MKERHHGGNSAGRLVNYVMLALITAMLFIFASGQSRGERPLPTDVRKDHGYQPVDSQGLKDRVVSDRYGFDHEAPEARPRENGFHDDRTAEKKTELESYHGHDRNEGVAERVLPNDEPLGHALGPRGADVLLVQDFEEGGKRESRHDGGHDRS